jgi:hypothetical protein
MTFNLQADGVCETASDGELYADLYCWMREVSLVTSRQRFSAELNGSARFGVHCKKFPIHLMVHDGYRRMQFPKVPLYHIEEIVEVILKELRLRYTEVVLEQRDRRNHYFHIKFQRGAEIVRIIITSERQGFFAADSFIGTIIEDYPQAKDFIRTLKAWGVENGILCPDFQKSSGGCLPDTAFTCIAASVVEAKGCPDFKAFFGILTRFGSGDKVSFDPTHFKFNSHMRRKKPFVHVSFPYSPCENAASSVDPMEWISNTIPKIINAANGTLSLVRSPEP